MSKFKLPSGMAFPTSGLPKINIGSFKASIPDFGSELQSLKQAGSQLKNIPELKESGLQIPDANLLKDIAQPPDFSSLQSSIDKVKNFKAEDAKSMVKTKFEEAKSSIERIKEVKPEDIASGIQSKYEDTKNAVTSKYSEAKGKIDAVKNEGVVALIPEDYKQLGQMAKDSGMFKKED